MGRTSPSSTPEVLDIPRIVGELRELAGRIIGIVEVLERDLGHEEEE